MLIILNNEGQVVDIQESTLVANSTYGDSVITVTFDESVSNSMLLTFNSCTLSVIRNDSVVIDGLYMEKVIDERAYQFNSMTDSGILDVTGSLQLSIQIKTNNGVFASVTLAAFVQKNIGKLTKEEANDVETRLKALYITPMSDTLAKKLDMFSEADDTRDKAYILLSTSRSEGSDNESLKKPYAFISRTGQGYAYGILGATKDGDYLIPYATKDGNPVNLAQLNTILADYIKTAEKGVAGGVAPLGTDSRVPYDYLPTDIKETIVNLLNKVDKLEAGARDKLYCKPAKSSNDQNEFRYTNETGDKLAHSVLAADSNGDFHVPEPQKYDSPMRKTDVESGYVNKSQVGQKKNGIPELNESGTLDKEYLADYVLSGIEKAYTAVQREDGGKANGYAKLDDYGKVPAENLPAYVDDVLDVYVRAAGTTYSSNWLSLSDGGAALTPEGGKIYVVVKGTYANHQYRWSGSQYVEIVSSLALGETTGTAYDGGKGKALDTRLKTAETNINELTSNVETLNTETETLKETTTEHDSAIEKNTADIEALTDKIDIGEVVVSDSEPTEEQVDAWIDTSESEIPDTVLKAGDGIVVSEKTDDTGKKVIDVAVKTSTTSYSEQTDNKTYSNRSSYVKKTADGYLLVRDSNQTFKVKDGKGFNDDAIVTIEADNGIEIEEINSPPTIKIKNTKKRYRHYIKIKFTRNGKAYIFSGFVDSSLNTAITDLKTSLKTLLGVSGNQEGILPLYGQSEHAISDDSTDTFMGRYLSIAGNKLTLYWFWYSLTNKTSPQSSIDGESSSISISLVSDTVVEI